jgi:hypothetical protein
MPFDFNAHMRRQAEWLLELSRDPGWREHARHRLQELLDDPLYAGFEAIWREVYASASPSPSRPDEGSTTAPIGRQGPAR